VFCRAVVLALLLSGCEPDGAVRLRFERPEAPGLNPMTEVRELTLRATADGEATFQATRPYGESVEFGALPLGVGIKFALTGAAAGGRVVAFGHSGAPVDVTAEDAIEVEIPVRRPFSYVAGADGVVALDGTLEPGEPYEATLDTTATVTAVASTPDGGAVVFAAGAMLGVISTSTHTAIDGATLVLDAPVTELAISPDGRAVVAVHAAAVSVVDLPSLRAGTPTAAEFVATGDNGRIAVGNAAAWVIQDPLDNLFCQGESAVLEIPLDDPSSAGPAVALGEPAGDLAIAPDGRPIIAMVCDSQLVAIEAGEVVPVANVEGLSTVTIADGKLWAMGHVDGEAAHLILASVPLAGGEPSLLDLPTLEERADAPEFDAPGQGASIQVTADLASAFDLAVLPDGEHVAILVAAIYFTEEVGDAGFGVPILPAVTMITYEYQLVQLATGLGAQRLRMSCEIEWEPGAVIDEFRCGQAPGQDLAAQPFIPAGLTALYGSR